MTCSAAASAATRPCRCRSICAWRAAAPPPRTWRIPPPLLRLKKKKKKIWIGGGRHGNGGDSLSNLPAPSLTLVTFVSFLSPKGVKIDTPSTGHEPRATSSFSLYYQVRTSECNGTNNITSTFNYVYCDVIRWNLRKCDHFFSYFLCLIRFFF